MKLVARIFLSFLLACTAGLTHAVESNVAVSGKTLLDELRRGGYIVYFRHTKTLPEHAHESNMRREGKWRAEDCSTQRNLSVTGLSEAEEQRDWVAKLSTPFGTVYSSSACRARLHAERVARGVEIADALTPVRNEEKALVLRKMLNTAPAPGINTFMFAHGGILFGATGYDSVESETFVFRPATADKRAILVASIKMADWALLARGEVCCAPRALWRGTGAPQVD